MNVGSGSVSPGEGDVIVACPSALSVVSDNKVAVSAMRITLALRASPVTAPSAVLEEAVGPVSFWFRFMCCCFFVLAWPDGIGAAWFVRSLCGTEIFGSWRGLAARGAVVPPKEGNLRGFWRGRGGGGNATGIRCGMVGVNAAASSRATATTSGSEFARAFSRADGVGHFQIKDRRIIHST